ncbi:hypothetical protein [Pseudomonas sp. UMAB-40]|uniref:hypothetical protein n=1 Tax=Pseudomonas sp. UMAB-40 TaxID=1365407 RepID=UPI001C5A2131|nr:hypothetical protein [Pseudomonas sp. UMAB-40]
MTPISAVDSAPEYAYARRVEADVWVDDSLAAYLSDGEALVGTVIARAIIERPQASHFLPDADKIIEVMAEEAQGSDYSEFADDFPTVSDEAQKELEALLEPLKAWADRHCSVSFFSVTQPEPYTVTATDIAAAEQYRRDEVQRAEAACH